MEKIDFEIFNSVMTINHLIQLNKVVSSFLKDTDKEKFIELYFGKDLEFSQDSDAREDSLTFSAEEFSVSYFNHLAVFHRQTMMVMAVAAFEGAMDSLAIQFLSAVKSKLSLKDFHGTGTERTKTIFSKLASVNRSFQKGEWQQIVSAQKIRNKIAHGSLWEKVDLQEVDNGNTVSAIRERLIEVSDDQVNNVLLASKIIIFDIIDEVNSLHANS